MTAFHNADGVGGVTARGLVVDGDVSENAQTDVVVAPIGGVDFDGRVITVQPYFGATVIVDAERYSVVVAYNLVKVTAILVKVRLVVVEL